MGQTPCDDEFASAGAAGNGSGAAVASLPVRAVEQLDVVPDSSRDPGGEDVPEHGEAQLASEPLTRGAPWDELIDPDIVAIYRRAGFLREVTFGRRPAVLVVDAQYKFAGDVPAPIMLSTKRFRFSCGDRAWDSVAHIRTLLRWARARSIPVVYTRDLELPPDPTDEESTVGNTIIHEVAPLPGDKIVDKEGYSGFFATRLLSYLISLSIDTLIVVGGTTSGCVRATVTDAYDYRFKVFVVQECVFDRAIVPHLASLFDIAAKAANVLSLAELTATVGKDDFAGAFDSAGDNLAWRFVR